MTEANVASFEAVLKQEIFCEDYRQNIRKKSPLYYESQMDNRNLRESRHGKWTSVHLPG